MKAAAFLGSAQPLCSLGGPGGEGWLCCRTALALPLCPCCSTAAFGSARSGAGLGPSCPGLCRLDAPSVLPCYSSQL